MRLGKEQEANEIAALLSTFTRHTPKDDYWDAHKSALDANFREALNFLRKTTQNDPENFPAWFVRGNCYYNLLRDSEAIACFNACIALRPKYSQSWKQRGLAHLRARNFRQALDDFDKAISLQPNLAQTYLDRAVAHRHLNDLPKALADLTAAIGLDSSLGRVYFLRAEVRRLMGDKTGAEEDDAARAGRKNHRKDELGWVARGLANRDKDPNQALADFEERLEYQSALFRSHAKQSGFAGRQIQKGC